jgi:hypothetical protein
MICPKPWVSCQAKPRRCRAKRRGHLRRSSDPICQLERSERRERHNTGIIHQDVDAPEFRFHKIGERPDVLTTGDVKSPEASGTACGCNRRSQSF